MIKTAPLPAAATRQDQIIKALTSSSVVVSPKSEPARQPPAQEVAQGTTQAVVIPSLEKEDGFTQFSLPGRQEELTIILEAWEFRVRTAFVSENDFTFSFGFDEKQLSITPKFEAACSITYRGKTFPAIFGGGNIKFPGLPFTILSFFKDNRETKS